MGGGILRSEMDTGYRRTKSQGKMRVRKAGGHVRQISVPKVMQELPFPLRPGFLVTNWPSLSRMRYHTMSRKLEARRWQTVSGWVVGFRPVVELSMNDLERCNLSK